jgi:nitrate reductase delta subunit
MRTIATPTQPIPTPAPPLEGEGKYVAPAGGGAKIFRALAALLDYPSARLQQNTESIRQALGGDARLLAPLLAQIEASDLMDLQEQYFETFDRGRRTSLNLFEHVYGDSRDRGQAMVDLLAMYEKAGVQFSSDQLPDYLPAFLDYLALVPDAEAAAQLNEIAHIVAAVGATLARRKSPYAAVFDVLLARAEAQSEDAQETEVDAEDDTTYAAIDAAWAEAPVEFLGAAAPCGSQSAPPREQPIQIHRSGISGVVAPAQAGAQRLTQPHSLRQPLDSGVRRNDEPSVSPEGWKHLHGRAA